MKEIPKAYDASKVEDDIYKAWEQSGFFAPEAHQPLADNPKSKESFTISMPPPNATGILHIGHAMFLTIQDVVARYQRMQGKKVLWLPGTDHAAIATNAKVEKILLKEGKDKHDLGREKFIERVDDFVAGSRSTIQKQIRKMGSSCDWSRERFTLDEGLSLAVRTAFKNMYDDGLIYRGNRIVNWCPHCESTLSDDEVVYKKDVGKFYHFKYGPVIIGTVRPETKFLDKTIVVHPDDKRYKKFIGKEFEVEWIDGKLKANVVADKMADPEFGTGAMTITPAHSFEDFDIAQKHKLPVEKIIDEKGNFTDAAGKFKGKNARKSREAIVAILKKKGLVEKVDENYEYNLSICYRCATPVEPLTKEQWFMDVNKKSDQLKGKTLKQTMLQVVRDGSIKFIPKRFEKTYFHWIENLRDWCISRQIWYGHRIPVYYCKQGISNFEFRISNKNSKLEHSKLIQNSQPGADPPLAEKFKIQNSEGCPPIVSIEEPKKCPHCGSKELDQDPDTLDTWFSSGLWTFSTLGWPKKTKDLKTFHPTQFMETGYDILFFWVARMILMSTYHMKEIPFQEVYLHGLVRDEKGRKMSKSLDNIIDPLDLIPKYGTDAIRLSLLIGTTPGNDINLGEEKIAGYRNFVNKLWNISRYVLTNVKPKVVSKKPVAKTLADKWILSELDILIKEVTDALDKYHFSSAGEKIYEFTWNKFADWYIEITKIRNSKFEIRNSHDILNYVLQNLLKLWHPFCPFVTEEIWKQYSKDFLMIQQFPAYSKASRSVKALRDKSAGRPVEGRDFEMMRDIISGIRNIRAEYKIAPEKKIDAIISVGTTHELSLRDQSSIIKHLARLKKLAFEKNVKRPKQSASIIISGILVYIPISGIIDINKEKKRIKKEIDNISKFVESVEKKLKNKKFIDNAPKNVVEGEREKLKEAKNKREKLADSLLSLQA